MHRNWAVLPNNLLHENKELNLRSQQVTLFLTTTRFPDIFQVIHYT